MAKKKVKKKKKTYIDKQAEKVSAWVKKETTLPDYAMGF